MGEFKSTSRAILDMPVSQDVADFRAEASEFMQNTMRDPVMISVVSDTIGNPQEPNLGAFVQFQGALLKLTNPFLLPQIEARVREFIANPETKKLSHEEYNNEAAVRILQTISGGL